MICELNAPASPRSPVTSRMPTRRTFSCSLRIGSLGMSPAASAAWRVMRRIAPAYGRSASMRCSALRSRAAATISIARVIFWMFLTDPMRFLMSFCAIGGLLAAGARADRLAVVGALLPGVAAALLGLTLLVEVVPEVARELLDRLVERLLGVVAPVAAGDLLERLRRRGVQPLDQLVVELADAVDADAVEVAVGGGVDDRDLVLDRHRLALVLVQRLDQPLAAGQRALGVGVEVRAELREGLEVAVLGQLDLELAGHLPQRRDLRVAAHARHRDADVDGRAHARVEEVRLEEDLAVGDRDDVRRDVGRHVAGL